MSKAVHIGRNIRAIRMLLDLKQEAFAVRMNISQQAISWLESQPSISQAKLKEIANVLNVSIEHIETFTDASTLLNQHKMEITNLKNLIVEKDLLIDSLREQLKCPS